MPESDLLSCDGNRLRALTPLECGEIAATRQPVWASSHLGPFSQIVFPTHVLQVDTSTKRPNLVAMDLTVPRLLTALQLHGFQLSGPGVCTIEVLPRWSYNGLHSRAIPLKQTPTTSSGLSQSEFEDACVTASILEQYQMEQPNGQPALALQRFSLGCSRTESFDSILDFVIALEALLLPSRSTDLSYRFRIHGAYFIADTPAERRVVFDTLNSLYELRSRIVHGGKKHPSRGELINAVDDGRRLAARGLLKAVRGKFPNSLEFTRMVLGELGDGAGEMADGEDFDTVELQE